MIEYQLENKRIQLLHQWDLEPMVEIVDIRTCTYTDVGKYIKYTDGSGLYTKIVSVSGSVIGTESGLLRRFDIIQQAMPKGRWCNYSGVAPNYEHPLVRPFTNQEKGLATRSIKGEEIKYLTPRVKMAIMLQLQQAADAQGWTPEQGIKNYVRISKGNGAPAILANDRLMVVHGVDVTKLPKESSEELEVQRQLVGIELMKAIAEGKIQVPNRSAIGNIMNNIRGIKQLETAEVISD